MKPSTTRNGANALEPDDRYTPPAWLRNAHVHTIYAACVARSPTVKLRRERWPTPDGDFIDLDWLADAPGAAAAGTAGEPPFIVLFHGLEGSSQSHYARTLMHAVAERGWRGAVVHFRGCSGEPNRLARAYHSGDSAEVDWILARIRGSVPGPLCAVAVSLGANVLLKWLGEKAEAARDVVAAACAISAPMDLVATGNALDRGFNRIYGWNFLRTLKRKSLEKLTRYPGLGDARRIRHARTLRSFDDHVTAPLHGFVDAQDYWTRSSSKPWLKRIAVPTLVLNACDDPFLPADALPAPSDVSAAVTLQFPRYGGHVGFVTGRFPGSLEWLPRRILRFIEAVIDRSDRTAHRVA
ncbi:MAG: hydrolase [Betaproteobacteria bacterium]|nr:MAG: hydrolase [Betaproteobacteria bacterium]